MASLNPEQRCAAAHRDGPMLVLAGPGTGKTATLVARFGHMVREGFDPSSFLSITFTRAAAQQLKDRMARVTGILPGSIPASTFHSFCLALLRRYPDHFGRLATRRLISDGEQNHILSEIVDGGRFGEDDVVTSISRLKDSLITPQAQAALAEKAPRARRDAEFRLAERYAAYQNRLEEGGLMDFGDLIMGAVQVLEADRALASGLSSRFGYLMVDEYQDINLAQARLIDALLVAHDNLWAVGDDDQSLYAWRGSDVSYILDFQSRYPKAGIVRLVRNYRSTPSIISAAGVLIKKNVKRLEKDLISQTDGGPPVDVRSFATPDLEAAWIAERIKNYLQEGRSPSSIAVLCRVGHDLTEIERALEKEWIPVNVAGAASFWRLPEVKAGLKAIAFVTKSFISEYGDHVPAWLRGRLGKLSTRGSFGQVAARVCNDLAGTAPHKLTDERREEWINSLRQLRREVESCATPDILREKIRDRIRESSSGRPNKTDSVQLCSIHAAKGLEWPVVFVAGWEEDVLPHKRADDIEEERRLAFVAMTRARDQLHLSYAVERHEKPAERSRFLDEILGSVGPGDVVCTVENQEAQVSSVGGQPVIRPRRTGAMKGLRSLV